MDFADNPIQSSHGSCPSRGQSGSSDGRYDIEEEDSVSSSMESHYSEPEGALPDDVAVEAFVECLEAEQDDSSYERMFFPGSDNGISR